LAGLTGCASEGDGDAGGDADSNADTDNQMRVNGGGYQYNLSTKSLQAGKDYTIRVRLDSSTGPIILAALFQPKKN